MVAQSIGEQALFLAVGRMSSVTSSPYPTAVHVFGRLNVQDDDMAPPKWPACDIHQAFSAKALIRLELSTMLRLASLGGRSW